MVRLIYKAEVLDRVGLSYTTIWNWMRQGRFPRSRAVGGRSAWFEHEIDDWLKDLPARRLKGDPVEEEEF
jgi:prophage regulatory protein